MFDLSLLYNLLSVSTDTHSTDFSCLCASLKIQLFRFSQFISPWGTFQQHKPMFGKEIPVVGRDQSKVTINISTRTSNQQPPAVMCRHLAMPNFSHSDATLPAAFIASELLSYTNTGKEAMEIKHFPSHMSVKMMTLS